MTGAHPLYTADRAVARAIAGVLWALGLDGAGDAVHGWWSA